VTTTDADHATFTFAPGYPVINLDGRAAPIQETQGAAEAAPSYSAFHGAASWLTGYSTFAELERVGPGSPTTPASAPAELPGLPGAPSNGTAFFAPGGGASSAFYALLLAFAALALLRFDRLQLRPVQWRCAAFVALLERPG
jgi:hypothetical protein